MGRLKGRHIFLAILVAVATLALFKGAASALFTDTPSVSGNTFNTDTLNPPTGLTASGGASISLNWMATVNTYASGHRVFRSTASGGPYTQIAQVTPRTTTTYTDNPASGTYFYVVRAYYQNWESANSNEASATASTTTNTGFLSCAANAAVTTNSGDNNGFETTSSNACADDATRAEDNNSGTNTSTACNDTGKDRHLFYNYGFSIPAGSVINGIEVRLDAWADSTSGSPFMCAEISWNGGASWTAAKTTATLGTAEATFTLGSASDTWGRAWSSTEFSNANFRVRITDVSSSFCCFRDFRLDWVAVQVTYTPP